MTIAELRSRMSYEEYCSWENYYKLEPWGFPDLEYRTGRILELIWNTSITKRSQAKKLSDFIRDPVRTIKEMIQQKELRKQLLEASEEERRNMIAQAFGQMGIKTK